MNKEAIVKALNGLLTTELTSMDLYLGQAHICEDWGYTKLHERLMGEFGDEKGHADALCQRILFLGGTPDMRTRNAIEIGAKVEDMLKIDLDYERMVADKLNEAIALCIAEADHGSRTILEKLLFDTEMDHIYWLEQHLRIIDDVGIQNYLQSQM